MQVVQKLETYMNWTYMYNVQNVHIDVTHPWGTKKANVTRFFHESVILQSMYSAFFRCIMLNDNSLLHRQRK